MVISEIIRYFTLIFFISSDQAWSPEQIRQTSINMIALLQLLSLETSFI